MAYGARGTPYAKSKRNSRHSGTFSTTTFENFCTVSDSGGRRSWKGEYPNWGERDQARNALTATEEEYDKLDEDYRQEKAAHGRTKRWTLRLGLLAAVLFLLLLVSVLVAWYLLAQGTAVRQVTAPRNRFSPARQLFGPTPASANNGN